MARSIGGSRLPPVLVDGVCTVYFPCSLQLVATRFAFTLVSRFYSLLKQGKHRGWEFDTGYNTECGTLCCTSLRLTHAATQCNDSQLVSLNSCTTLNATHMLCKSALTTLNDQSRK